jgi:formiminotetrahydrofolate cyclodeaminase
LAVARLIRQLHPVTNQNCLSDIGVAMQMARAAVLGAAMNVLINLPGTGDDAFNHEAAGEAKTAVHDVEGLAVETTRAVLASLG